MDNPPNNLQPAIQQVYADHRRIVKDKNRQINALQAEKGELQRALQERADEANETVLLALDRAEDELMRTRRERDHLATDLAAAVVRADKAERGRDEALIERAEKAEMESARAAEVAERWREAYDDLVFLRRADPSRPLTPDAITDEMVLRFWNAFNGLNDGLEDMTLMSIDEVRTGLSAALGEPPARPEGAEKVEAVLHQYWSGDIDGDDLADRIAEEMNR